MPYWWGPRLKGEILGGFFLENGLHKKKGQLFVLFLLVFLVFAWHCLFAFGAVWCFTRLVN